MSFQQFVSTQTFEMEIPAAATVQDVQKAHMAAYSNRRAAIFDILLKEILERPSVRILEIGVYLASNIRYVMEKFSNIDAYTGVDDYGEFGDSPYIGPTKYWANRKESRQAYERAKAIFDRYGQELHRETSDVFFKKADKTRRFDVVFVDGNHNYDCALRDMKQFYQLVADDGVMLIDDYDNPDTPDVTRAITVFLREYLPTIKRIEGVRLPFINSVKIVPISLVILALYKGK